jgi:hypothetical protein
MSTNTKIEAETANEKNELETLPIGSFDEQSTPDADVVSLGGATYAKGLGKIKTA